MKFSCSCIVEYNIYSANDVKDIKYLLKLTRNNEWRKVYSDHKKIKQHSIKIKMVLNKKYSSNRFQNQ